MQCINCNISHSMRTHNNIVFLLLCIIRSVASIFTIKYERNRFKLWPHKNRLFELQMEAICIGAHIQFELWIIFASMKIYIFGPKTPANFNTNQKLQLKQLLKLINFIRNNMENLAFACIYANLNVHVHV